MNWHHGAAVGKVMRLAYISEDISSVSYIWQHEELTTYFRVRELAWWPCRSFERQMERGESVRNETSLRGHSTGRRITVLQTYILQSHSVQLFAHICLFIVKSQVHWSCLIIISYLCEKKDLGPMSNKHCFQAWERLCSKRKKTLHMGFDWHWLMLW